MRNPDLKRKSRKVACVATLTAAGLSFGLVAYGGDSAETATAAAGQQASMQAGEGQVQGAPPEGMPGPPVQLTSKQEECLAGEGVELPQPSQNAGSMPDPEETQAAFEACDIEMPEPPSGQSGIPGVPPGQDSSESTAPPIESQSS